MKKRAGAKADGKPAPEAIPAAVVQDLVDANEQRIEELQRQLIAAVRRAEEAELRVALLAGDERSVHADSNNGPGAAPPRTTVVTRSRPPGAG